MRPGPMAQMLPPWVPGRMLLVYSTVNHVPMGGHAWGPVYLLIRAPLQAIILFWVYWFTIRQADTRSTLTGLRHTRHANPN